MIQRKAIEKVVKQTLEDLGIPPYIQISLIPALTEQFINNHISLMQEMAKGIDDQRSSLMTEISKLEIEAKTYASSGMSAHKEAVIQLIGLQKGRIVELNLLESKIKEEIKISDEEVSDDR